MRCGSEYDDILIAAGAAVVGVGVAHQWTSGLDMHPDVAAVLALFIILCFIGVGGAIMTVIAN
jgi:hypothetical protein